MKLTLISTANLTGLGSRLLSSYARKLGHETQLIFLPAPTSGGRCSEEAAKSIADLCNDSDIVGISVFTIDYNLAAQLSQAIGMRSSSKIIWGGIHPTVRPKECLDYADLVCVGEGESVIKSLLEGNSPGQIPGLWYKENGAIVENGSAPMVEDLSSLPIQDFSFENHLIVSSKTGEIKTLTRKIYKDRCGHSYHDLHGNYHPFYMTMSSRGCPFACTYCSNDIYHDMYTIKHYRMTPVEYLVDELEAVTKQNDFLGIIYLIDDSFFSRNLRELEKFSQMYKERINLPFNAVAYPSTIKKEKLEPLIDAGLCRLSMGIQSGSKETLSRYKRPGSKKIILEAVKLINKYKGRLIAPKFDVISNDPFQSVDEQRESLIFLSTIPGSFVNHSLLMFPGTTLNKMARERGFLVDAAKEGYTGYNFKPNNFYDILFLLLNIKIAPRWLVRLFAQNALYNFAEKVPLVKLLAFKTVEELKLVESMAHKASLWFNIRYRKYVKAE